MKASFCFSFGVPHVSEGTIHKFHTKRRSSSFEYHSASVTSCFHAVRLLDCTKRGPDSKKHVLRIDSYWHGQTKFGSEPRRASEAMRTRRVTTCELACTLVVRACSVSGDWPPLKIRIVAFAWPARDDQLVQSAASQRRPAAAKFGVSSLLFQLRYICREKYGGGQGEQKLPSGQTEERAFPANPGQFTISWLRSCS